MAMAFGETSIECKGFHFPKAILRTFQVRIEKSLSSRFDNPPTFQLKLERDSAGRLYWCNLDLFDGSKWYRSTHSAEDTPSALNRCLEQLDEQLRSSQFLLARSVPA